MELYDFLRKRVQTDQGYIRFQHITFTELSKGHVRAEITVDEDLLNPMGGVHGGCLFSICDTVGGTAAMTRGYVVTTMSGYISYLRPAVGTGTLFVEAVEIKSGRTISNYDVFVKDETGVLICKTTLEYYRLHKIEC